MQHTQRQEAPWDIIIVLGAAVWQGGQPSPALRARVVHAVQLWRAGHGRKLLMTGGLGKYPPTEAQLMRQLALAAGIPEACILVEEQATSTFQSGRHCTRMLRQHGWSTALIVTDCYHLPRAVLTFRSFGMQVRGSAPPGRPYSRRRWKRWYYRLREVLASVWYLGRIAAGSVSCCKRNGGEHLWRHTRSP
jgi:uncharacterized SAM-binding protein YcdF (DUF218 family)